MNNKCVVVILLCFLSVLSGCTRNISRLRPYNEYVGRDVELKRPVILLERKLSGMTFWHQPHPLKPGELYEMVENKEEFGSLGSATFNKFFTTNDYNLAEGTRLKVDKVVAVEAVDWVELEARGKVYVQGKDRQFPFVFTWRNKVNTNLQCISRAPWEDDSVPVLRFVGMGGQSYSETMKCE